MRNFTFVWKKYRENALLFAWILLLTPSLACADTAIWYGSLGTWHASPSYWSTGWVPMPSDDVVVSSTGQVAANTTIKISSLTLTPEVGDAPVVISGSGGVITLVSPWIYDPWSGIYWGHPLVYTAKPYNDAYNWAAERGNRLPTFQEFLSFVTQSDYDPTSCIANNNCWIAGASHDYGPDLKALGHVIIGVSAFWTTDIQANFPECNWGIWISTGYAGYQNRNNTMGIWMVRDALP